MNKINIEYLEYPQLRLDCVQIAENLKARWEHSVLSGNFWRLYHNDRPGAGVFINGRRRAMTPDKLYILPPDCELDVWCDCDNIRQLYFHFEVTRITGNHNFLFNELELTPANRAVIEQLQSNLLNEGTSPVTDLMAIALAAECLSRLPAERLQVHGSDDRITRVCAMIRDNPAEEYSLAELARYVSMAPNSFLRLFREITGITPYQYLLNIRYALAARLLRTTNAKIEDICNAIGVKDRFHFSRRFKNLYGMPPAAYREENLTTM